MTPWSPCCCAPRCAALADMEARTRAEGVPWQERAAETAQVRLWLDELDNSETWRDAADRLVAWLSERERGE